MKKAMTMALAMVMSAGSMLADDNDSLRMEQLQEIGRAHV